MRSAGWILFAALAAGCTSTGESPEPKARCQALDNETELVGDVFELVNLARSAHGLEPLVLDPLLSAVADEFACEMIEDGFLAHANPNRRVSPGERLTTAGYIYYAMGENIAAGQTSAAEVVHDWLLSESHRANLLSAEWREIGIAVRRGGKHGWYWVQEFADPLEFTSR